MYINDKSNSLKLYNIIYSPSYVKLAYLTFDNTVPRTITVGKDIVNSITHTQTDLTFNNAMFINNGFTVEAKYRNKGLGERIFKLLFETHPEIENILFYSNNKNAIRFWKRIGATEVLKSNGLILFNLSNKSMNAINETNLKSLLLESFQLYEIRVILKTRKELQQKLTTVYDEIRAVPYVVIAHPVKDDFISNRSDDTYDYAQINLKFLVRGNYEDELEQIKQLCLHGKGDNNEFKVKGLVAFVPRVRTIKKLKD